MEFGGRAHGGCSGISREALRRGDPYTCVGCGRFPPEVLWGAETAKTQHRCGLCEVTLRMGVSFAMCRICGRTTHKNVPRRGKDRRSGHAKVRGGGRAAASPT